MFAFAAVAGGCARKKACAYRSRRSGRGATSSRSSPSLRAGIPTILCPFFGDQPFWARRVAKLGVGPEPLDRRTLSAETLAEAIGATEHSAMRARAADLGSAIRDESGIANAVTFLEATSGHAR